MSERRRQTVADHSLRSTLAEIVLETSREELLEALGEKQLAEEARHSHAVIRKALQSVGIEPLAEASAPELHVGLGTMLRLLMRREGLSEDELAERAEIGVDELRRIQLDPKHEPSPRTIYRLERFFDLPSRSVAILAGAVKVEEEGSFKEGVLKFAAQSASMRKLTREERRHLSQFVKFLAQVTARASRR